MNYLSKRLRECRTELGMSQPKFGEYLGLKPTSYPNYEKYDTFPCIEDLKKIAIVLDISLDYLCGRIDDKKKLTDRFEIEGSIPFNKRLKELRLQSNMTQLQMTEAIGLHAKSDYVDYERGNKKPLFHRLIALADLFDVSLDYLVGFNEK